MLYAEIQSWLVVIQSPLSFSLVMLRNVIHIGSSMPVTVTCVCLVWLAFGIINIPRLRKTLITADKSLCIHTMGSFASGVSGRPLPCIQTVFSIPIHCVDQKSWYRLKIKSLDIGCAHDSRDDKSCTHLLQMDCPPPLLDDMWGQERQCMRVMLLMRSACKTLLDFTVCTD